MFEGGYCDLLFHCTQRISLLVSVSLTVRLLDSRWMDLLFTCFIVCYILAIFIFLNNVLHQLLIFKLEIIHKILLKFHALNPNVLVSPFASFVLNYTL